MTWSLLPDGPLEHANAVLTAFAGLPGEEPNGVFWLSLIHPDDRDRVARVALADVDAQVDLRRDLPAEAFVQRLVAQAQRRSNRAR